MIRHLAMRVTDFHQLWNPGRRASRCPNEKTPRIVTYSSSRPLLLNMICCLALLSAGPVAADEDHDDGLPRPEMGKDWLTRLLTPETTLDAFHELTLRQEEIESQIESEGYEHYWKGVPRAVFDACHADLRVTACPGKDGEVALYLISHNHENGPRSEWQEEKEIQVPDAGEYPLHPTEAARREQWRQEAAEEARKRAAEVFRAPPWKIGDPLPEDLVLTFVDPNGKMTWPFGGDNWIDGGVIADLNGDGILERLDHTNSGVASPKGRPRLTVQYLDIQTVEPDPRLLLSVVFNWHPHKADENNRWWFALSDPDGDGIVDVHLGPQPGKVKGGPLLRNSVTFRWDAGAKRYAGPAGRKGDHFRLLDPDLGPWKALNELNKEGGLGYPVLSAPPDEDESPVNDSPYLHQSLAGSSDSDLVRFMAEGAVNVKEAVKREEFSWDPKYVHPENLERQAPMEAAMSLAEANRTDEHRAAFELVMVTEENEEPPKHGSILLEMHGDWSSPRWEAIYFGEQVKGIPNERWLRHDGLQRDNYPDWDSDHRWRSAELSAERATWLAQTIWWLDQIRTVSRMPAEVERNEGFGADDITTYDLHVSGPDGKGPALVFPTTQGYDFGKRWRGHYDRTIAASLAVRLWNASMDSLLADTGREKRPTKDQENAKEETATVAILKSILPEDGNIAPGQVMQPVLSAVQTVGDREMTSLAPRLAKLAAAILPPDAAEVKLHTLAKALEEAREARERESGTEAWKREDLAEYHYQRQLDFMRDHPGHQLRKAVALAERQLESLDDAASLKAWAKDNEAPGAAWAMSKLNADNQEAPSAIAAQTAQEESEPVERAALVEYLTRHDPPRAVETFWLLSEEERLPLTGTVFRVVPPEDQVTPKWREQLISFALRNPGLGFYRRAEALRHLVPDENPMRFADSCRR